MSFFRPNTEVKNFSDIKDGSEANPRTLNNSKKPIPSKFIFHENTFPQYVKLPTKILLRKVNNKIQILNKNQITVYFDDVMMPFQIVNGRINIQMNANPFMKVYKHFESNKLPIDIFVYLNGKAPKPELRLVTDDSEEDKTLLNINIDSKSVNKTADNKDTPLLNTIVDSKSEHNTADIEIIYKSTFCFYRENPAKNDLASDSDSDDLEDESLSFKPRWQDDEKIFKEYREIIELLENKLILRPWDKRSFNVLLMILGLAGSVLTLDLTAMFSDYYTEKLSTTYYDKNNSCMSSFNRGDVCVPPVPEPCESICSDYGRDFWVSFLTTVLPVSILFSGISNFRDEQLYNPQLRTITRWLSSEENTRVKHFCEKHHISLEGIDLISNLLNLVLSSARPIYNRCRLFNAISNTIHISNSLTEIITYYLDEEPVEESTIINISQSSQT